MPVEQFFSEEGPLANHLEGYEQRPGQVQMAGAIEAILEAPEHGVPGHPGYAKTMLVEAETGIGKSLAYLVPAVLSGRRVVVSTATINLQDQLIEKEIPLLEAIIGESIGALCVKGRQNYLCHYRWYQYRSSPQLRLVEDEQCERIDRWLQETETGDRAELDWLPDKSALWPKISAHSYQCLGNECAESSVCFVNRLRKKAHAASLLVVNHHLYFSDLALKQNGYGELLPRHEAVIFDEAHHLENTATTFFGRSFSQYQIFDLVSDVIQLSETTLSDEVADRLIPLARAAKSRTEQFATLFPPQRGRYNLVEVIPTLPSYQDEVMIVCDGLNRLSEELSQWSADYDQLLSLLDRTRDIEKTVRFVALPDTDNPSEDHVYWYERRERAISVSATPVNVSSDLQKSLYASVPCCILTSATLSSGGEFHYVLNRLGLGERTEILKLQSPFDYQNQALLYVPEHNFPEPADPSFDVQVSERIASLINLSRGRTLVLCTSFKGMDMVADYLEDRITYPLLVQGSASRSRILEQFKNTTDSVLVAVASFWEGVDIPGESLSSVLIDKLPFEVPSDPVVQARMHALRMEGRNPFFEFQVPRAVLSLRQGVGRLMRTTGDTGLIGVMDVRLYSKRYGKVFLKSLPPAPVTRDISMVENFFTE